MTSKLGEGGSIRKEEGAKAGIGELITSIIYVYKYITVKPITLYFIRKH